MFITYYNACVQHKKGMRLCVVHGYGSSGYGGKIRSTIRQLLDDHKDRLEWRSGEQTDGNPGVTYVKADQLLPEIHENLAVNIIEFCDTPKTREKIAGHFRKHGDQCVLKAIRYLQQSNQLTTFWKGKHKCYVKSLL
ncbi:MAG: Smr/MutS family protein [Candidatus Magnetomorum sp.]|nr:Smr/MutS family protein [Candidatus Magnetomorum sp.]